MSIITTMRVLSRARCGKMLASLRNHDGDSNENGKKSNGFRQAKQQFARASRFFAHFAAVVARLLKQLNLYLPTFDELSEME